MVSSPKFSIIVPVYNVEKFLRACLDSIINQTFTDFEVICINDGSTDASLVVLQEYANKDNRFRVVSQENQGQGVARNNGIGLAQGEYIIFVDPDDFIELNALEIIYDKFQQTDVDIVQFDFATCEENGKFRGYKTYKKRLKKEFNYNLINNQIYNWQNVEKNSFAGMSLCVWDKAYKADLIKKYKIKLAPYRQGEDHIFSISANLLANKILYINKALYHYRTRYGSAVNKASNDNFCIFENIGLLKDFLIEYNFFDEYKTSFESYVLTVLSWHWSNIPAENMDRYLNMCRDFLTEKDYNLFLKKTKGNFSLLEKFFSLKNQKINGLKVKCITILGFTVLLKPKRKVYG